MRPPGSDQAERAQTVIERQVGHLARLVDDLLDVTRIVARQDPAPAASASSSNEIVAAHRRGPSLRVRGDGGRVAGRSRAAEPLYVNGDATRLAQVIGNLLQNAAKFTGRGGGRRVSVSGRRRAAVRPWCACATPARASRRRLLPRLFEPFTQADRTLDRSRGGLGLGLALVKGLVELHGGEVRREQRGVGQGRRVHVRFPLDAEGRRGLHLRPRPRRPSAPPRARDRGQRRRGGQPARRAGARRATRWTSPTTAPERPGEAASVPARRRALRHRAARA